MIGTVPARQPEIDRDRLLRPLVVPPTGGRPVPYTRCTTFVGSIDEKYMLHRWQMRHLVKGVVRSPDLIAAITDTSLDAKADMDGLVDEALERSGAGDAAKVGTYLHKITEAYDRGEDPGDVETPMLSTGMLDPSLYENDLKAYVEATRDLTAVQVEQFTVQDPLKVGGTPDRVVTFRGKRYIGDLKSGDIERGILKIAAQLAMYARSRPYDVATGERMEAHGAELDRGIIVHLPAGTGTCRLWWVNLAAGWDAVRLCRDVRQARTQRFPQLAVKITDPQPAPVELADRIALAATREEVEALWRLHASEWNDEYTSIARRHIAALAQQ